MHIYANAQDLEMILMRHAFRLAVLVIAVLISCTGILFAVSAADKAPDTSTSPKTLTVHYLDVGQADSILIQAPSGKTMLIDAGNSGDSEFITDYIKELKIKKIDVLIGTHPHEDHIGGMEAIIKAFDIGKIYMPKASASTQTYKNLLTTVKNKKMKITTAVPGALEFDADLKVNILAPNSNEYKDLNDFSVVVKVTYSKTSFLFTGDAEEVSEKEMINKKYDLKADVLKVGHHGSQSSTSRAFLKAVSPGYAVISAGKENDYGHPDKAILDRLEAAKVKIFRTDIDGTVIAKSDGKTITFDKKPSSPASSEKSNAAVADANRTVYYTEGGKSYHYSKSCSTLSRSKKILSGKLSEVIKLGKADPCDKCVK